MSMLDRVKNAVLGNPVEREYDIGKHIASAGPQLQWKIHQGTRKSTQKAVSVFIFQKRSPTLDKMDKKSREKLFEVMRRGPQQLAKLRHPLLLTIDHALEETRDVLVFATEPVQCCVANVLGNYTNLPQPLPFAIKNFEMDDVEIRIGMLAVLGGLQFLHNDAKLIHGNVTPESIVVVQSGAWKLAGFHFHTFQRYQQNEGIKVSEYDSKASISEPNLDYVSPERVLNRTMDTMSDIWSYGVTLHTVYNKGQVPAASNNNLLSYKQNIETISRMASAGFGNIPLDARDHLKHCLSMEPTVRPDALASSKIPFYNDSRLQILQYLETLMQRPDLEKSQFFKNLHKVLGKLPKRVTLNRVLPAVFQEFKKPAMIPFALPNVLIVVQDCTLDEYALHVWPSLKSVFTLQEPIQIMLLLLQKMDLLLTKTAQHDVKHHILPMIYRALESGNQVIQELVVTILPNFASMVDYSSLKHHMVPRITNLCLSTSFLKIRVNALVCIGRILDHMDKWMVQESILPVLQQIPSREAGVLMAILGIYREILNNKKLGLEKLQVATVVLPFLVPLSVEPSLNATQFGTFMSVIRDMLHAVEMEHMAQLKEAGQMESEVEASLQYAQEAEDAVAMDDMINRMEEMFTPGGDAGNAAQAPAQAAAPTSSGGAVMQPFGIGPPAVAAASATSSGEVMAPLQPPPSATPPIGSVSGGNGFASNGAGVISSSGPAGPSLSDIFGSTLEPIGARPVAPAPVAAGISAPAPMHAAAPAPMHAAAPAPMHAAAPAPAPVAGGLDENPFASPLPPSAAPAPTPAASWSSGLQSQATLEKQRADQERERERQRLEAERQREEERRRAIQEQQRKEEERKRQEQLRRQEEERKKQEEERRRQQEQQRIQQQQQQEKLRQQQQQQQQQSMQGWGAMSTSTTANTSQNGMGWGSGLQTQGMATSSQPTSSAAATNTGWGSTSMTPSSSQSGGMMSMGQPLQPQAAGSMSFGVSHTGQQPQQNRPQQQGMQQPMMPMSGAGGSSMSQPLQPAQASGFGQAGAGMSSGFGQMSQQPMQPSPAASGFGQQGSFQAGGGAQQQSMNSGLFAGMVSSQPMQPSKPASNAFSGGIEDWLG
ncbi:SCY1-like protein 2 [Sycon ciliatum]|uniref:SCY1-like protein 2 n=1 Tax=Sycon ciliatum TaxID=27933 RepID=UPI0031F6E2BE